MKNNENFSADGTVASTEKKAIKFSKYMKEEIFIICIIALPILWWALGFVMVTGDSIILAFKEYDRVTETFTPAGFKNFLEVFKDFTSDGGLLNISLKNSLLLWVINTFLTLPVSVLISFALHKKIYGAGAFKIILFLPQIVSSSVWVLIYSYFVDYGIPNILGDPHMTSLLTNISTDLPLLLIYQQWLGFAGGMIIYTGAMSRIPDSLVEAGHLDGMKDIQEFFYIVIPLIFPTLSVVITTCVIGIFTSSLPTYQFFAGTTRQGLYTFGHYMFQNVMSGNEAGYPMVSAVSMVVCIIATPFTLVTKWLLEKYGPTVEY